MKRKRGFNITPRHYEEKPFVIIEFKGFDFPRHAYGCEDCKNLWTHLDKKL